MQIGLSVNQKHPTIGRIERKRESHFQRWTKNENKPETENEIMKNFKNIQKEKKNVK